MNFRGGATSKSIIVFDFRSLGFLLLLQYRPLENMQEGRLSDFSWTSRFRGG